MKIGNKNKNVVFIFFLTIDGFVCDICAIHYKMLSQCNAQEKISDSREMGSCPVRSSRSKTTHTQTKTSQKHTRGQCDPSTE